MAGKSAELQMFEVIKDDIGIIKTDIATIQGSLTDHVDRLARLETKVDNLNNIRKLVMGTIIRWVVPAMMAAIAITLFVAR